MKNNNIDVALWGPSIRTHLWKDRVENLKRTNNCNFKIFFSGPIIPKFDIPKEIVFAHCTMHHITPSAEIARRLAVKSGAKYIFTYCDDVILSDGGLDTLIRDLESQKEETVTGPAFRPTLIGQHGRVGKRSELLNLNVSRDSCLGVIHPFMKRETALRLEPGADRRFRGGSFDRDLLLRLHEFKHIQFRTCEDVVISEDMSVQLDVAPTDFQSIRGHRRYGSADGPGHDGTVQKTIWDYPLTKYRGHATRLCKNEFFTDDELIYTLYIGE
jgi:hypothetical protein